MSEKLKTAAQVLLSLNLCMYTIVLLIGCWSVERAMDHGFVIGKTYLELNLHLSLSLLIISDTGKGFDLPAHFSPIYFPMGNAATGFFVVFALIAGVVGAASAITGLHHIRRWGLVGFPANAAAGHIAWALTLLALGFAWKEIELSGRNSRLITMEAFIIILSATQLFYIATIHVGAATA